MITIIRKITTLKEKLTVGARSPPKSIIPAMSEKQVA